MGYVTKYVVKLELRSSPKANVVHYYKVTPELTQINSAIYDELRWIFIEVNDYLYASTKLGRTEAISMFERISRRFPNIIIEVTGYGEETEDIWRAFCCAGISYSADAKIEYPKNPFKD